MDRSWDFSRQLQHLGETFPLSIPIENSIDILFFFRYVRARLLQRNRKMQFSVSDFGLILRQIASKKNI